MNKSDVEKAIAEELRSIFARYKRYNPEGKYLNLVVLDDEDSKTIMFWDGEHDINYYGQL